MPGSDVAVVGAGVIGLTCAVRLAEAGRRVTVISDTPPPRTTSAAAGALWGPYLVESTSRVREWSAVTLAELTKLAANPRSGVRLVAGIEASRTPAMAKPDFANLLPDLRPATPDELPDGFASGWRYTAPSVDMSIYLPYLQTRLEASGGQLHHRHLDHLSDASRLAPIVVNATGLGARRLVPDPTLYPTRGQLVVIDNPGITEWFSEDTGPAEELLHIYPHGPTCVLGGLAHPHHDDLAPNEASAQAILQRCAAVQPLLRGAHIRAHRVGLRPTRPTVRLDVEHHTNHTIAHCYGHGGAGITLSWGCANDILKALTEP